MSPSRRQTKSAPLRHSLAEGIDRAFSELVTINESGVARRVPVLEAIVLQLVKQDLAGNRRAGKVLRQYQRFATRAANPTPRVVFVESDYTNALKAKLREE
ncbi:MAG: hypothetical protein A4S14_05880 [Proteobacteria bacterium SG_bin9]|nr:MAG: hypothetical protein A4S14_05880 [Proteobacteria bacterium SG_bin9]